MLDSVPETCEKYPFEHAMHDVAPANTAETDSGAVFSPQDRQHSDDQETEAAKRFPIRA